MRELIIKRLEEIREQELNFSPNTMRWRHFFFGVHISKVKFDTLTDEELLQLFELIIRRLSKQMIYDADMVHDGTTTPEEFYEMNKDIMDRVFQEYKMVRYSRL